MEYVTAALNFEGVGYEVDGGAELYTTKPTHTDKTTFKIMKSRRDSKHHAGFDFVNTPFGNLLHTSRFLVFANLIQTLNAAHYNYNFHYDADPNEFSAERNMRRVMNEFGDKISLMQPKPVIHYGARRWESKITLDDGDHFDASRRWGESMWSAIDSEMDFEDCVLYTYRPKELFFDEDDRVLQEWHHFFVNSRRHRVCYLWARRMNRSGYFTDEDDNASDSLSISSSVSGKMNYSPDFSAPLSHKRHISFDISSAQKRIKHSGELTAGSDYEHSWDEDDEDMYAASFSRTLTPRGSFSDSSTGGF